MGGPAEQEVIVEPALSVFMATSGPESLLERAYTEAVERVDDPDETRFVETYKETMRLRNEFHARARADLAVVSGELPEPNWTSLRP